MFGKKQAIIQKSQSKSLISINCLVITLKLMYHSLKSYDSEIKPKGNNLYF